MLCHKGSKTTINIELKRLKVKVTEVCNKRKSLQLQVGGHTCFSTICYSAWKPSISASKNLYNKLYYDANFLEILIINNIKMQISFI